MHRPQKASLGFFLGNQPGMGPWVRLKGMVPLGSGTVSGSAAQGPPLPAPAPTEDPAGARRVPGCNGRRQGCSWEPQGSFPYPTTAAAS